MRRFTFATVNTDPVRYGVVSATPGLQSPTFDAFIVPYAHAAPWLDRDTAAIPTRPFVLFSSSRTSFPSAQALPSALLKRMVAVGFVHWLAAATD